MLNITEYVDNKGRKEGNLWKGTSYFLSFLPYDPSPNLSQRMAWKPPSTKTTVTL